eukprot:GHVS01073314.1.p1 GENE.GHVS01073314.1~~GHVS01073314.1.p1  ORF type:complete len:391 (+),score=25.75 GHVS01073314.1:610-1782(+)
MPAAVFSAGLEHISSRENHRANHLTAVSNMSMTANMSMRLFMSLLIMAVIVTGKGLTESLPTENKLNGYKSEDRKPTYSGGSAADIFSISTLLVPSKTSPPQVTSGSYANLSLFFPSLFKPGASLSADSFPVPSSSPDRPSESLSAELVDPFPTQEKDDSMQRPTTVSCVSLASIRGQSAGERKQLTVTDGSGSWRSEEWFAETFDLSRPLVAQIATAISDNLRSASYSHLPPPKIHPEEAKIHPEEIEGFQSIPELSNWSYMTPQQARTGWLQASEPYPNTASSPYYPADPLSYYYYYYPSYYPSSYPSFLSSNGYHMEGAGHFRSTTEEPTLFLVERELFEDTPGNDSALLSIPTTKVHPRPKRPGAGVAEAVHREDVNVVVCNSGRR